MRSAVLLAGGRATRLGGISKPLIEIGGVRIIDRIISALETQVDEFIAVVNDDALANIDGLTLVYDEHPHHGVLPALSTGLAAARGELCLVVAADLPFVNGELFRLLCDLTDDLDLVIPIVDGRTEPMHAVYRRESSIQAIAEALTHGEQRMNDLRSRLRVRYVEEAALRTIDPGLRAFINVNTDADLLKAHSLLDTR